MRYYIILFSLLLTSLPLFAQQSDSNILSISAQGTVELPADVIRFNINLNAEAESPKEAYELHQQREKALVGLLDQYNITKKDINFEPISISKSNNSTRYTNKESTFHTRQSVSVKFTDFDIYGKIQIALIEEGFDSFNGNFLSTKTEEGKDEALKKAIQIAKEKASLIAGEAGVQLGSIVRMSYSYNQIGPVYARSQTMALEQDSNSLMKYDQTVTITSNIGIDFEIVE